MRSTIFCEEKPEMANLDQKIASIRFSLDQLAVGRDAFMQMLKSSLETQKATK